MTLTMKQVLSFKAPESNFPSKQRTADTPVSQWKPHIAHLPQQCHISKFVIFQEIFLKTLLKGYNCLWVQRRHNRSPVASFTNCVMTLYLLKVHLQTFLPIPITQKCQILSCDTLVANERYHCFNITKNVFLSDYFIFSIYRVFLMHEWLCIQEMKR